jgi:hypothetical protein
MQRRGWCFLDNFNVVRGKRDIVIGRLNVATICDGTVELHSF